VSRIIKKIVVHCADTFAHMDIGVKEIRGWHVNENGWADVGYHFVIRRNGSLETGRPIEQAGAHVRGHNHDSIGICLVGGKGDGGKAEFNFTARQMFKLNHLVRDLKRRFNDAPVYGHRDFDSGKACPCFSAKDYFSEGV
jgi:N-acetylmuramoyl-L-alanine amidase